MNRMQDGSTEGRMTLSISGPFGDFVLRLSPEMDKRYRELSAICMEIAPAFTDQKITAPERALTDDLGEDIRQFLTILVAVKMIRGPEGLAASDFLRQKLVGLGRDTLEYLKKLKNESEEGGS